ncbi:MAG: prolyl oligopeptidase family serine peptidase [Armatimonadota bacterium]
MPSYPETRRESVTDLLHGVEVADPFRWLEDSESEEVRAWTEAQNAVTREVLQAAPARERIEKRLPELLSVGVLTPPVERGGRYFYQRREGTQDQPVLCWREGLRGEERVLLDPAVYEPDAASALDWWYPTHDGQLVAYGISRHGDEKSTLGIRRVATGEDLPDRIPHTRFCALAWLPDGSGFYYTRYPEPGTVPSGDENYGRKVYFHAPGTDWHDDPLIFGEGRAKEDMLTVELSPDGRWLLASAFQGWAKSELYLLDRHQPEGGFVPVAEGIDALFIGSAQDDALYLRTNLDAPRYRILRVDPNHPQRDGWRELVPEGPDVIEGHGVAGGYLACELLRNASSAFRLHRLDGSLEREIELPGIGSVFAWEGRAESQELFLGFLSFTTPPTVLRHEVDSGATEVWGRVEAPISPGDYEVRQVWYPSRDGTQVSMFIVHRKGLELDGDRPTLLYGYGGFNVPLTPAFVRGAYLLLERGGVYAMANLRGGGEYGEAWHRAGMLTRKQNVFDDCIAAAEYLIREGYTRPERLALQGGSNGGLLVGAVVTQRPDLFRAAVCQVPLLDMVRYHHFSIARLWIPEYGSSDDPEQFRALLAYSPYHRVRPGQRYPALLITAAESDTRVDPLHARKLAARLQTEADPAAPVLLRIETRAGHGAGKPLAKVIEEAADIWSFLFQQLEVDG